MNLGEIWGASDRAKRPSQPVEVDKAFRYLMKVVRGAWNRGHGANAIAKDYQIGKPAVDRLLNEPPPVSIQFDKDWIIETATRLGYKL